jgi:hypothetical protein
MCVLLQESVMKYLWLASLVAGILLFADCTTNVAGNSTQTGNAAVVGILYQADGKTPAPGVRVHIRPRKSLADTSGLGLVKRSAVLAATDSVLTDAAGRFSFDTSVDTGTYVIEATSGNNAVFVDSVPIRNKQATDSLPPDTLKPAGALKGIVLLSEGGDPRKVFILAFGIDRFAPVNADGSFKFGNLAAAKYDVRLISSLDNYGVLDTFGVPVRSGDTTNLDTIRLPFTGIPTPKNVRISYDTMKEVVTLTWNKADTALVKSYNVYRRNVDSNTVAMRINASPVVDTVYKDSTGVQGQMYEYRVAAVDTDGTEGVKSAIDSVKIVGLFTLVRTWGSLGSAPGQMNGPVALTADSRGLLYVADENNNRIQVFDSIGRYVREFGDSILLEPCDIVVQDSFLFVATNGDKKIHKLTLTGDTVAQFVLPANSSFPHLAVDSSGNIYTIPSATFGQIQLYGSTGLTTAYPTTGDYLWGIRRIGNQLFCFNDRDSLFQVYSSTGTLQESPVLGPGIHPAGIVGRADTMMVLNSGTYVNGIGWIGTDVLVYNSNFQYIGRWGGNVPYVQVSDIATDNFGNVYILDTDSRQIRQFRRTR